jgi:hypothetical protein
MGSEKKQKKASFRLSIRDFNKFLTYQSMLNNSIFNSGISAGHGAWGTEHGARGMEYGAWLLKVRFRLFRPGKEKWEQGDNLH